MLGDEADQALASPGDGEVDNVRELKKLHHRFAPGIVEQGDGSLGQAFLTQPSAQGVRDGDVRVHGIRAASKDHRVSGHQAECRGIGRHIRPRLVDHRDDTEWNPHPLHDDAIGTGFPPRGDTHGIGERRHVAHGGDDTGNTSAVEAKTVEHRPARAVRGRRLHVPRVCL